MNDRTLNALYECKGALFRFRPVQWAACGAAYALSLAYQGRGNPWTAFSCLLRAQRDVAGQGRAVPKWMDSLKITKMHLLWYA